jgi:integrase
MAQEINRLKAIDIPRLTDPGMYPDGDGLYLQVKGPAARSWVYRYTLQGKARWMGLGSVQTLSLGAARLKRNDERQKIKSGVDPVAVAKVEAEAVRAAKEAAVIKVKTFADCVDDYLNDHNQSWRNAKHRQQWRSTLETYAFPIIRKLPLAAITAAHVVEVLRPIWIEKNETARRVRGRIEAVLDYAANPDDLAYRNPAALTAQLRKKLPRLPASRRPKHHAALPYSQIGRFMSDLVQREGSAARALEFLILTATRTSETLLARWDEIDLAGATWTIPGERMKAGKPHRVPLSDRALGVIKTMREVRESDFMFPGLKAGRPLSNMALLAVLDRMGRAEITAHGFRSTFRDWAGEHAKEPREVAEAALAHVIKDKSEAAYARSDLLERRRPLMARWAKYCGENLGAANVVDMRPVAATVQP